MATKKSNDFPLQVDSALNTNKTSNKKAANSAVLSSIHSSILKEIEDALIDPPAHGTINFSFIYRDKRFTRMVLTREVSRQVE